MKISASMTEMNNVCMTVNGVYGFTGNKLKKTMTRRKSNEKSKRSIWVSCSG